jgi:peptidoglycan/xylan/chitin deacetylase (PgdA/CDA1 family)
MSNFFILNYHTIVPRWGFDVACRTLDIQFRILSAFCDVVPLEEICNLVVRGTPPRRTTVAVTFDDGYLDTFVYAVPLCKKHRIRATLFPIASRIINDERLRPTLEDHWRGSVAYRDLYRTRRMDECNEEFFTSGFSASFMSAAELRKASETVDIGSHGSVHARVFCDDRIIDLYDGANGNGSTVYACGEKPQRGFPLFPDCSSLAVRHGTLRPEVKAYVRAIDKSYFLQQNWKMSLRDELLTTFPNRLTFENDAERRRRVENELVSSKQRLAAITGRKPRYFAYPYGHRDTLLEQLAADHFAAGFTTDIDIVRMHHTLPLLPRAKVHRDISSFISRLVKFSRRK